MYLSGDILSLSVRISDCLRTLRRVFITTSKVYIQRHIFVEKVGIAQESVRNVSATLLPFCCCGGTLLVATYVRCITPLYCTTVMEQCVSLCNECGSLPPDTSNFRHLPNVAVNIPETDDAIGAAAEILKRFKVLIAYNATRGCEYTWN